MNTIKKGFVIGFHQHPSVRPPLIGQAIVGPSTMVAPHPFQFEIKMVRDAGDGAFEFVAASFVDPCDFVAGTMTATMEGYQNGDYMAVKVGGGDVWRVRLDPPRAPWP
jgi:hypothetical protein